MAHDSIPYAYTFDDLLLLPGPSTVLPNEADLSTRLTKRIKLNIPIVSAAMDTVTESETAISLARQGGIGILHRNLVIEAQALEVAKVKKSESGMILAPVTIGPREPISKVLDLMERYRISGIPVVEGQRLVGIVTNRDLRFETNQDLLVNQVMTKDELVTAPVGITLEESKALLHQFRIEKLLVVDDDYNLKGLITIKDIEKIKKYPLACKDEFGRLRVGGAVGVGPDREERVEALLKAGADVIVIDTAHGHSERVLKAVEATKRNFPEAEVIAGNVGTAEGAGDLIKAGVDAVKVGVGPGSICTTRVIAGVGVPQITAIMECAKAARQADIPVVADGGIKFSGDVTKALAAGAACGMVGSLLAGCGGLLWSMKYPQINPFMGIVPGLKAFIAAVLGGIGNLTGAVVGGLLLGLLEVMLVAFFPSWSGYRDALAFALLIIILLVRPTGLLGEVLGEAKL